MLDREKIVAVLKRRFPGSTPEQVAEAANSLVGLDDEWVEVPLPPEGVVKLCVDMCYLRRALRHREIRIFSRTFTH